MVSTVLEAKPNVNMFTWEVRERGGGEGERVGGGEEIHRIHELLRIPQIKVEGPSGMTIRQKLYYFF